MQLTERFSLALEYACRLHATQYRKASNVPYVAHLLAVAAIALEHGASEDEAIAALLHDAIEDQGGAPVREEIRRRFGTSVADIVDGCTDSETIPKPPWRERKEKYLAHLGEASPSVRLVCAADKLHNVRSLVADYRVHGEALWDRFNGGRAGTLWYYREIARILISSSPQRNALVDELARVVDQLQRMADAAPGK
jgi:(p)ppGpp synthase/HD superfamily hydrolase